MDENRNENIWEENNSGVLDNAVTAPEDDVRVDDYLDKRVGETASDEYEPAHTGASEEYEEKTMEMDSLRRSDDESFGITPRDEFTDLNSADNMSKTRLMDSINDGAAEYTDEYGEEDYETPIPHPVKRRRKKKSRINHTKTMGQVFLGVVISVAAMGFGIFFAVKLVTGLIDVTGMAKKHSAEMEFELTDNMTIDDIVNGLHDNGIINSPSLMKLYIKVTKKGGDFLPGPHKVNSSMSYTNIIEALQTEMEFTETITITIPEGLTVVEIGKLLEENFVCRAVDFEEYVKSKKNLYDFETGIKNPSARLFALEGYLFPDTYEFYVIDYLKKNPNYNTATWAKEAADKMMDNFEGQITKRMKARMSQIGMSLDEVLTLASLIQWEGNAEDNMAMISSVFHNRLDDPENYPRLESDTTYTYADLCIKPRTNNSNKDQMKKLEAAYDTYKAEGLPPGPICSPGIDAINAALYPDETDYYYFLAARDGTFYWAQTAEQHEQNVIDADLKWEEEYGED